MQENTPSQAEGERPDDNGPSDEAEHQGTDPGRATPSQAEGDRDTDTDDEAEK